MKKFTAAYWYSDIGFNCWLVQRTTQTSAHFVFWRIPGNEKPMFAFPEYVVALWHVKFKHI